MQALLNRIDILEYRVLREQRDENKSTREELERLKASHEADRLEAADNAWADAWARAPRAVASGQASTPAAQALASHRGPGALAPSSTASTAPGPLQSLPPPKSPDDSAAQAARVKKNFTNSRVASRTSSRLTSPSPDQATGQEDHVKRLQPPDSFQSPPPRPEMFSIGSPPGVDLQGPSASDLPRSPEADMNPTPSHETHSAVGLSQSAVLLWRP